MNYNPEHSSAVFLGPSLAYNHALHLYTANYYPPAQMGDIYCLLGSGVRRIVIIDGLFHGPAAIWQREILEALDNGLVVVGAASMGALRAAELYPFGMIGYGTIFEWYRNGFIDGDDEVALLHGDETVDFQPLSEPLVNLRYTLQQAAHHAIISSSQVAEVIAYLKTVHYVERSYPFLLGCAIVKRWPQSTQNQLRQFLAHAAINLKKQDAINVLRYCATTAPPVAEPPLPSPMPSLSQQNNLYYQVVSYQHRGFLQATGELIKGKSLLAHIAQEPPFVEQYHSLLSKTFFVLQWAKQRGIDCPAPVYENYRQTWEAALNGAPASHWLRANGLTERELYVALEQRALLTWLMQQGPAYFGLALSSYAQLTLAILPRLPYKGEKLRDQVQALWAEAVETWYLTAWARENGINCPPSVIELFRTSWAARFGLDQTAPWLSLLELDQDLYHAAVAERALCEWLIEKGPHHFGYAFWSFEVALIKELQISGRAAALIAAIDEEV